MSSSSSNIVFVGRKMCMAHFWCMLHSELRMVHSALLLECQDAVVCFAMWDHTEHHTAAPIFRMANATLTGLYLHGRLLNFPGQSALQHCLHMSMTACGKDAAAAKVPLCMEGEDTKALASGCKSHRTLEKLVKGWKVKAILPAVEEPEVATARPVQRVAEVVFPVAGSSSKAPAEEEECVTPLDMGEPAPGGRKSVPAVPSWIALLRRGSVVMPARMLGRGAPSFTKRKAPKAAPTARATKIAKASESTIELTKHVAASTTGGDADESSSEAEVKIKIIGERAAEVKIIRRSCTIAPRAIKPLPAHAPPAPLSKGMAKAIDTEEVLALALAENADLKEEVVRLKEVLVELISVSNRAYSMSQDWATVEQKMSELLD
ncbi:hypothetical protein EV702DRAFT_1043671 [Suillus placidus]|uniref:Uncharacterized protein n=1 Tax=Suillus placidus TaxID=48579 RepID=A0A9P7A1L4_9AGAM|nr:hypothetical protein EV702DRAFT_1043671 [Suillus placidus]